MKTSRLVNAMNYIDDELIMEAGKEKKTCVKTKRAGYCLRWGLPAAVCMIVLLCGGVTVMAATGFGTRIIEMYTAGKETDINGSESGYVLSADVIKIPEASLSDNIKEISDIIIRQYEEITPFSSQFPGSFSKKFSSALQAREYIGLDILRGADWNFKEQYTTLMVLGNEAGEIKSLHLETCYRAGDMTIQEFSNIYTDKYEEDVTYGTIFAEDAEFEERFFTTENDVKCHVITTTVLDSGYVCTDGFLVRDGILYNINIAHLKKDSAKAERLLRQWADQF